MPAASPRKSRTSRRLVSANSMTKGLVRHRVEQGGARVEARLGAHRLDGGRRPRRLRPLAQRLLQVGDPDAGLLVRGIQLVGAAGTRAAPPADRPGPRARPPPRGSARRSAWPVPGRCGTPRGRGPPAAPGGSTRRRRPSCLRARPSRPGGTPGPWRIRQPGPPPRSVSPRRRASARRCGRRRHALEPPGDDGLQRPLGLRVRRSPSSIRSITSEVGSSATMR